LPAGTHDCTLAEIGAAFGNGSPRRRQIFDGLTKYLGLWQALSLPVEFYIDGGYTTRKAEEPGDVDVVIDITNLPGTAFTLQVQQLLDRDTVKATYFVDAIPRHDMLVGHGDCRAFFAYVRQEARLKFGLDDTFRKGLLRLVP